MSSAALAVSTGFMAVCCGLACIGRRVAQKLLKPGLVQELFFEAIASAEMCAVCFELIIGEYQVSRGKPLDKVMSQDQENYYM